MLVMIAESPEAMIQAGREFAEKAVPGTVIGLVGKLGAGKTHWTKGFVEGMGSGAMVTSPTFGLVHEYPNGRLPIFHFDFYRLKSAEELIAIGWDDYLDAQGVVIAEWADQFPEVMPAETTWLRLGVEDNGHRSITQGLG